MKGIARPVSSVDDEISLQDMFLEDRVMMNPLSLLDFSEAKGQDEIYVRVDGPMPAESKK